MSIFELLALVVDRLNRAGIPHMLAGSIASTYYGEPRTTQDIDMVIDPDRASLQTFVQQFDAERFYVGDALGAFARRDQFNVVESSSGWKVDLIIRKDRAFSREEFARRVAADIGGVVTSVATPEDVVLSKLEWAKHSGSDRQLRDVVGVLTVSETDEEYLRHWARELGVEESLEAAFRLAQEE